MGMTRTLPTWNPDMSDEERIMTILQASRRGLTQDDLAAAIGLWRDCDVNAALLYLVLSGEATCDFQGGPDDDRFDVDRYKFTFAPVNSHA